MPEAAIAEFWKELKPIQRFSGMQYEEFSPPRDYQARAEFAQ